MESEDTRSIWKLTEPLLGDSLSRRPSPLNFYDGKEAFHISSSTLLYFYDDAMFFLSNYFSKYAMLVCLCV